MNVYDDDEALVALCLNETSPKILSHLLNLLVFKSSLLIEALIDVNIITMLLISLSG